MNWMRTAASRARALVRKTLVECRVSGSLVERLAETWVVTQDYLFDAGKGEADFVIGNPPYVRLEDIPEETAFVYRKAYPTMRGRADLYVALFEAALRQLRTGGVCAFICADRWMRNQYGAELRRLITSAYSVEVLLSMHNVSAFHDEVDAYPASTVIRHNNQGANCRGKCGTGNRGCPTTATGHGTPGRGSRQAGCFCTWSTDGPGENMVQGDRPLALAFA